MTPATLVGLSGRVPSNFVTKLTRVRILLSHYSEICRYISFNSYPVFLLDDSLSFFFFLCQEFQLGQGLFVLVGILTPIKSTIFLKILT